MSEIDSYKHSCLGMVELNKYRIPIYRLEEDVESYCEYQRTHFYGKSGDILFGGGGGEHPAMRISIPEAFIFYSDGDIGDFEDIHICFWSHTTSYRVGCDLSRAGWIPDYTMANSLEGWLTRHILGFIIKEYPKLYETFKSNRSDFLDGSICKLPNEEERRIYGGLPLWRQLKLQPIITRRLRLST